MTCYTGEYLLSNQWYIHSKARVYASTVIYNLERYYQNKDDTVNARGSRDFDTFQIEVISFLVIIFH